MILFLIAVIIVLYTSFRLYIKFNTVWCKSQTCLIGKTVIITGANSGIGYNVALDYAKRGARVILACRNEAKAIEAQTKIIKLTNNKNVIIRLIDMASLKSVRLFAADILATEDNLHILVNNAGIFCLTSDEVTEDGLNNCLQVNYFSHFLLTVLLTGLLRKSEPSRIVNVSSFMAKYGKTNVKSVNNNLGIIQIYSTSKLYQILFTQELAKKLKGTGVSVFSVHPGVAVDTGITRNFPWYWNPSIRFYKKNFSNTAEEIAQSVIYAGIEKGLETHNGQHLTGCGVVKPYKTACNPEFAKELFDITADLVKLQSDEISFC